MSEATQEAPQEAAQDAQVETTPRVPHVKERRGVVVSAKMDKTVVVAVERRIKHKRYKRYVRVQKRYAAHDELGVQEGDLVLLRETRPLSKRKRWKVARKLGKDE